MAEDLVIASNRGPLTFSVEADGTVVGRQGAGGLVSSLGPLIDGTGATWVAAAMSDADRMAARSGLAEGDGFRCQLVDIDPEEYARAYDVISNSTLWFLNHRLFDLARAPKFDAAWREAWQAYRAVNRRFAEVIADHAPDGATVLVQDYHLNLVGSSLATQRPDLRTVHFTHTPFMDPVDLRVLPDFVAHEVLEAMVMFAACGFHTREWASAFEACCSATLGTRPNVFVSPLAPDVENMTSVAATPSCRAAGEHLDGLARGRRVILRVDRIELSKNLLRGFAAYDELLRGHPELAGTVVFVALTYPSREGLAEYRAYRAEVEALAAAINARWGDAEWTPILLDTRDDYPRSVAALQRYDVLLVNPIRDGLNLVALEGPLVNERDGVLLLSREAGVWSELSGTAIEINPFDVFGTAAAMADALAMTPAARHEHAAAVRAAASVRTPRDWLEDQLSAARS
ncbi:MAG: trehalose-6-phosphate synthase [Acidimicrobiales bacterium]